MNLDLLVIPLRANSKLAMRNCLVALELVHSRFIDVSKFCNDDAKHTRPYISKELDCEVFRGDSLEYFTIMSAFDLLYFFPF